MVKELRARPPPVFDSLQKKGKTAEARTTEADASTPAAGRRRKASSVGAGTSRKPTKNRRAKRQSSDSCDDDSDDSDCDY